MDEIRLGSRTLQPRRQLLVNGRREPIGKRALDILSVLGEARGEIVTKDELLDTVWPGVTVEENALQVHIVALRKALGPEADRLKTIRGVGYQLDIDGRADPHPTRSSEELNKDQNSTASLPEALQAVRPTAAWERLRHLRPALVAIAMLAALLVAGLFAGPRLGLWGGERIPVVVRTLAASGSGDPTEAALANGITDELIDRLRRIPELRIATIGTNGSVQDASFNNAYVVDGSIRRSGDQLRVTTRLSDAKGEILWSETFDRQMVDLLDMQERVAASIADTLSVSLDVGANSTAYGGTDNPEAYAAYLEASANGLDPDPTVPMRQIERALALDPSYVQALAAQSGAYDVMVNATAGLTRKQALELLAKADESSRRAIAANPNLWIGHGARAWYYVTRHDLRATRESLRRVEQVDHGNEPGLRSFLADFESMFGRQAKALALYDSSELIDPLGRYESGRATALMNLGRYREAMDLAQKIGAGDPVSQRNLANPVFWSSLARGQEQKAIVHSERYFPLLAQGLRAFRAATALPAMSPAELRRWATRRYGEGGSTLVAVNALYAGNDGHPQLAVDLMRVAFERPGGGNMGFFWYPAMADARKTDEFEKLVTDIGLVNVWRESGDWGDYCRPVSATEITCT